MCHIEVSNRTNVTSSFVSVSKLSADVILRQLTCHEVMSTFGIQTSARMLILVNV